MHSFRFLVTVAVLWSAAAGSLRAQQPLTIGTTALPYAPRHMTVDYSLVASGGQSPYLWSITSGSLPAGLNLDPATGRIAGSTSDPYGTYYFTAQVTDANNTTASKDLSIDVKHFLENVTLPPPAGLVGTSYSYNMIAAGGQPPYTWTLPVPPLPPGLSLSSSGAITGVPTAAGSYFFAVDVTDVTARSFRRYLVIEVFNPGVAVTTSSLHQGYFGVGYSVSLSAIGGQPPYSWSLAPGSGGLPEGLSLSLSGEINGAPMASGTFPITVQVTDSLGVSAHRALVISVNPAITVTTHSLPVAVLGVPYSFALGAIGGQPPYSWTLSSGTLDGIELRPDGTFVGTPGTVGTSSIVVRVTDGTLERLAFLSLTTVLPLQIVTPAWPDLHVGDLKYLPLAATGGKPPYVWSLAPGSNPLPAGLSLQGQGGVYGQINPPAGTYGFTVRVIDSSTVVPGGTALADTKDLSLTIVDSGILSISSIDPYISEAGGPDFALTVSGTSFTPNSVVHWDNVSLATTYLSPLKLTALVPANLIASQGTVTVSVVDPAGGTAVSAVPFLITNPAVIISSLIPDRITGGSPGFTLTVQGEGFVPQSLVHWDGLPLPTVYAGPSELTAAVDASLIAMAGGRPKVTVVNPPPAGISDDWHFAVDYPRPSLHGISPSTRDAGQGDFVLTLTGTDFFPSSRVHWNSGLTVPTTFVSATELRAHIGSNLTAIAGSANVLVENLNPGGGFSETIRFTIINPGLAISSLEPPEGIARGSTFTLTVHGDGFVPESQVVFGQTVLPTTFVSSSQVTATVDSGLIFAAGERPVTVVNPAPVGPSQPVVFVVGNPQPLLDGVSPDTAQAGTNRIEITLTGAGFNSDSQVLWNEGALPASSVRYLNPATLTVEILSSYMAEPGFAAVKVFNPQPGGGASSEQTFTISDRNIGIESLTPQSVRAGDPSFTLTVRGHGFDESILVSLGFGYLPTTFISPNELAVTVDASLIVDPGSFTVRAGTPVGQIVRSNAVEFLITSDAVTISNLSPGTRIAGRAFFNLQVNGGAFVPESKVHWNGEPLSTLFQNSSRLIAGVDENRTARPGAAEVTVVNPPGQGGSSNAVTFAITPLTTIYGLAPAETAPGSPGFSLTVRGSGFSPGWDVRWNGLPLVTSFVSSTELVATVSSARIAKAGVVEVTVVDPAPQGGTSNAVIFTITDPNTSAGPIISSLDPSQATAGGAAFVLTIHGNGFAAGAQAQWNGAAILTDFVSASELTANIAAALIADPGTAIITVLNSDPGGGLSNALAFTIAEQQAPLQWQISLLGGPAPAQQHPVQVSLSQPSADLVTGRLGLAFTADPMLPPGLDDPAIEFSRGGRTAAFVIPAGGINADFGGAAPLLQTGTVAGEITLTVSSLRSGGADITPSPAPAASFVIGRQAPTIDSVRIVNLAPASFGIEVVGFATAREITSADFQFAAKPGQTLPAIPTTAALGEIAQKWYQDPASADFGSQFVYTRTFAIEGPAGAIASVAVTLSNSVGKSNTVSATF